MDLGLTPEQRAARKVGGSDANILMSGDAEKIHRLWEEKTGQREPDDLSNVLAVMMGHATEPFNRFWFSKQTGRAVTRHGESAAHPTMPYMTATLDGVTETEEGIPAVFEAKHVGGFESLDTVVQRYMPQLHHNGAVIGLGHAVLSVFIGNSKWEKIEIALDPLYTMDLIDREAEFWRCVETRTPPGDLPPIAAPVPPEQWRTVDMGDSNEWAVHAADWLDHAAAAKAFTKADKGIKGLVDPDVGHAFGRGVQVKRAKNGALRVTALK